MFLQLSHGTNVLYIDLSQQPQHIRHTLRQCKRVAHAELSIKTTHFQTRFLACLPVILCFLYVPPRLIGIRMFPQSRKQVYFNKETKRICMDKQLMIISDVCNQICLNLLSFFSYSTDFCTKHKPNSKKEHFVKQISQNVIMCLILF